MQFASVFQTIDLEKSMQPMSLTHNPVRRVAAEHPVVVKFGRLGWFAKGVVYILAGVLALLVVGRSLGWSTVPVASKEASPTGAIREVAQSTGGPLLLSALAAGLFLYALWRLVTAVLPGSTDTEGLAMRVGYCVSAVMYTTFGVTAISLAKSRVARANGNQTVTDMTARIMQHTAGRWLIGVVGAVIIAAGLYRVSLGMKGDVARAVDLSGMSSRRSQLIRRLGAIGEIGRGIAMGLIGLFLIRAALTTTAAQATGLDGALRRLALVSWGELVVVLVGVGLLAYGLFCVATFTRQRLQAP
jgi:hypothetical protein